MSKLQIGDVVKLNSGGPSMTVQSVDNEAIIGCYWDRDGKTEHYEFPSACLTKK